MPNKKTTKKGRILFIFLIIIIIPAVWFLFFNNNSDFDMATEKLTGTWLRSDGTYTIKISDVLENGKMTAAYFNPNSIHVEKSEWSTKDKKLQVYVEMNDVNYIGSKYKLTYHEETNQLVGHYYQAVAKQTYEVSFNQQ